MSTESPPSRPPLQGRGETPSERRRFLVWLSVVAGGVSGLLLGVPFLGLLVTPSLRRERGGWFVVGRLESFERGKTVRVVYVHPELPWAGTTANRAAYVRRTGDSEFVGFSVYCTHTGCPVNWVEGAELFLCPCHGGAFNGRGQVVSGPPPRPLDVLEVRVRDGAVEVLDAGVPLEASASVCRAAKNERA